MSQTPDRKNRFQVSREVQDEFVGGIAETMLKLTQAAGRGEKIVASGAPVGVPFSAANGREYGGANMVRLMLTSIAEGYADDRWMTFKQLEQYQAEHPDRQMGIKKGERGVRLLRPEEIFFTVDKEGKWNFLSQDEARDIEDQRKQGADLPPTQHKTLFYPFTVFNAEQIAGFPPKERPAKAMTEMERNILVERFVACSGVSVEHHGGAAAYAHADDQLRMPFPDTVTSSDTYYAAMLREFYAATGHAYRENRLREPQTLKTQAVEEMRGEMFSMLAGAKLHLPMPENSLASQLAHWNRKFSGGEAKEIFQAATDAAKMVTTLNQFEAGERPKAWWFPKQEAWPELEAMQTDRYAAKGVFAPDAPRAGALDAPGPRSEPPSLDASVAAFQATDDLVAQARLLLQNPDFLDMALKQDPNAARELASLCDMISQALHMELDERQQVQATPAAEQQTASAPRMRM